VSPDAFSQALAAALRTGDREAIARAIGPVIGATYVPVTPALIAALEHLAARGEPVTLERLREAELEAMLAAGAPGWVRYVAPDLRAGALQHYEHTRARLEAEGRWGPASDAPHGS